MYVGIDPEVAATHRQLVNHQWAETERLRRSTLDNGRPGTEHGITMRQRLGSMLVAVGTGLMGERGSGRTTTAVTG